MDSPRSSQGVRKAPKARGRKPLSAQLASRALSSVPSGRKVLAQDDYAGLLIRLGAAKLAATVERALTERALPKTKARPDTPAKAADDLVCAEGSLSVPLSSYTSLQRACTINLGPSPIAELFGKFELKATLPVDFEHTSSHASFLENTLERWFEKIKSFEEDPFEIGSESVYALVNLYPRYHEAGLYWDFDGYFKRATRYAVATLYAFAGAADDPQAFGEVCHITDDELRSSFRGHWVVVNFHHAYQEGDLRIEVDADGRVIPFRTDWRGLTIGFAPGNVLNINDGMMLEAALADYYFWWGNRLLDYALTRAETEEEAWWYATMSMACARAGLAEIVDYAGLILHEFTHWSGWPFTWGECDDACCHYVLSYTFVHRIMADLALPIAHLADHQTRQLDDEDGPALPERLDGTVASGRFDFDFAEGWTYSFEVLGTDCAPTSVAGRHHDFWTSDHSVDVDWEIPKSCERLDVASSGSQRFR